MDASVWQYIRAKNSKPRQRKPKAVGKLRPAVVRSVYFYEDDEEMAEVYEALAQICPSATSGGPNITEYLRSHKDQILREAKGE